VPGLPASHLDTQQGLARKIEQAACQMQGKGAGGEQQQAVCLAAVGAGA
jgi:hypothetical protein